MAFDAGERQFSREREFDPGGVTECAEASEMTFDAVEPRHLGSPVFLHSEKMFLHAERINIQADSCNQGDP